MSNNTNSSLFPSLLLVAFIVLKLCGVIQWSWLWVLSPMWGTMVLVAILFVFYVIFTSIMDRLEKKRREQMTPEQRASEACRNLAARLRKQP